MHIRPFEIALIVIFVLAALLGVFIIANQETDKSSTERLLGTSFNIWGTADQASVNEFLKDVVRTDKIFEVVEYREIDPRSFENELVNAIAEGRSPELILIPHSFLATLRTKLQILPATEDAERFFRDTYVDGAEIFMLSDGIYGKPIGVDPLVMYWNRDIFASSGLAQPPKTWETLLNETTQAINKRNSQFEVTQSAMSFGEFANVSRAKEILSMLFLQAGSTLVEERSAAYKVTLNQNQITGLAPGESVLSFYTQFANPASAQYSWNRSKVEDRRAFLQGTLALYFGMGSDRFALEEENANLNFDMAEVPQGSGATTRRNFGEFYAFAIPRGSQNTAGATFVTEQLGSPDRAALLATYLRIAPVHRSKLGASGGDVYQSILNQAALIARGWLDPDPLQSRAVLQQMVEGAQSSGGRLNDVISDGVFRLETLFNN